MFHISGCYIFHASTVIPRCFTKAVLHTELLHTEFLHSEIFHTERKAVCMIS